MHVLKWFGKNCVGVQILNKTKYYFNRNQIYYFCYNYYFALKHFGFVFEFTSVYVIFGNIKNVIISTIEFVYMCMSRKDNTNMTANYELIIIRNTAYN